MTFLGLSVISWASFLSKFSRYRDVFSRLVKGDGNVDSTSNEGVGLRGFVE